MAKRKSSAGKSTNNSPSRARILEWGIGTASACALVALVFYLAYLGLFESRAKPVLVITSGAIERHAGTFHVGVSVANRGGKTAAQVLIRGRQVNDRTISFSETVFDYVPAGSSKRGTLVFDHDPVVSPVDIDVIGYHEP